jgi:hypothetical protein
MENYIMPVKAIKNILLKELEEFKSMTYEAVKKSYLSDVCANLVIMGYSKLKEQLEKCNSYESLEEYVTDAGYRMHLEEWINSL